MLAIFYNSRCLNIYTDILSDFLDGVQDFRVLDALKSIISIPKPTIKVNSLYNKYNNMAAVVYYIPQSLLTSFLLNINVFTHIIEF